MEQVEILLSDSEETTADEAPCTIIEHAIMHYLDASTSEKKIVSKEIKSTGPNGAMACHVLEKLIERAHETTVLFFTVYFQFLASEE